MRLKHLSNRLKLTLILLGLTTAYGVTVAFAEWQVRRSTAELLESARTIKSSADLNHWIESHRREPTYDETSSPDGTGKAYKVELSNWFLSRIWPVRKTGMLMQVSSQSGQLVTVIVGIYNDKASAWVQEEFNSRKTDHSRTEIVKGSSGKPVRALIVVPAQLGSRNNDLFGFNRDCFTKLSGCETSEEMLSSQK